jgi:hypothetical protein
VYRRTRLFRTLDAAVRKRVVWINAPAGAGKTSVVTTYLQARGLPALWYNVDARDSDVANLFHYLAMAARVTEKRTRLALPVFSVENQAGIVAFARGFFEALGAVRPIPSAIVIDDYQEARSELLDEVLREALFALPRGVSAIIISRTEAPPWLARHVASGDVASVGWADLRFTPPEIEGLVRVYRRDLRGQQLKTILPQIIELSNGWAAALTLLLQTRRLGPVDAYGMEEFSERLFDYFATEILDKATPALRDFLLKTSVVPRFTSALAARLTGQGEIGEVLGDLEKRSFLTQRLGDSGAYRYHPLLRGFLGRRAEAALGATAVKELHRRAGQMLVEQDLIDEAMEQFQTSDDVEAVAELLLRLAPSYIIEGRGRTIETWIRWLPPERTEGDGWMLHWAGLSCLAYAPTRSRELLERAYAIFARAVDAAGMYSCCAAAIQAVIFEAMDHNRCDVWLDRVETLEREGPHCPDALLPTLATGMLLGTIFHRPEPRDKPRWAQLAMKLAAASNDTAYRLMTGGFLALRSVLYEDIDRATIMLEMLRETAKTSSSSPLSVLSLLHADIITAWAGGDNAASIALVREALAVANRSGVFVWNDHLCAIGITAAFTAEDYDAAREFLALAKRTAEQQPTNFATGSYYFYASWDAFLSGDLTRALRFTELSGQDTFGFPLARALVSFAKAQIHWKGGQKEESRAAITLARQRATHAGYSMVLFACDLVESDHEWDENRDLALERLRRGLTLARQGGFHNSFWLNKGTLMSAALRALEHGIETEYARASIAKHRLVPPQVPFSAEAWPYRYRFRALGTFDVVVRTAGGGPSTRKHPSGTHQLRGMPLRLLQAIVTLGARGVRDRDLIDALWPDAEGDAGRRVFDTTLHRLRRQLGEDDVVRLTDGRVYLDERTCWIDVWALERALLESERLLTQSAPTAALTSLAGHMLALYRGPLLASESIGFATGPRARLADRFRRTVERLAAAIESGGSPDQAEPLYQRAFQANHSP